MLHTRLLAFLLAPGLGCGTPDGSDDVGDDSSGSDDESDTTSDGDESESTAEAESETEGTDTDTGDEKPGLGDTPNVQCEGALASFALIAEENLGADPDPSAVEAAYIDTALQDFVQLVGALTGRVEDGVLIDDAAILGAIASGTALDLLDVEWRIYFVMHLYVRHQTTQVSGTLPDPANDPAVLYAVWDGAWCYWDGALRSLGEQADAAGPRGDEGVVAAIDEAFLLGHDTIEGRQPWAIDEWQLPAARQQLEKSLYTLFHRLVHAWAIGAEMQGDTPEGEALAHMAFGAFQPLEDRLAGRNTPGIAIIEDQLLASPSLIDPADVLRQMNIAFVKRTRRYSDHALPTVDDTIGTAPGYVSAVEGQTYGRLVDVYMVDALEGFDLAGYRASWDAWVSAVEVDDLAAAEAASADLVDWNCQYQVMLGIAECTGSADEPGP